MILFIFLALSAIYVFPGDNYSIYREGKLIAVSEITADKNSLFERVLWLDGYSKEYTETKTSFGDYLKYSSKTYYENNKIPLIYSLNGTNLEKRLSEKNVSISLLDKTDYIKRNSSIALFLYSLTSMKQKLYSFDLDRNTYFYSEYDGKSVKIKDESFRVFKSKNFAFDSAFIYGLKIIREKNPVPLKNPYSINFSKIYTEDDFTLKKRHILFSFDCFSGELSYDNLKESVVVILPFSFSSDYNGNIGGSIKPYTSRQIAEYLTCPVISLQIDLDRESRCELPERINKLEKELKSAYSEIIFIAFNDICIDLCRSKINSKKILINPPLTQLNEWERMMFAKYSAKKEYLFTSFGKFKAFEAMDSSIEVDDLSNLYAKSGDAYLILSRTVMTKEEVSAAERMKNKAYYIKNIDRRLNSYNIYDLWSFENNIFVNKKVLGFINSLIKK
ncbi:MAG: hypothetical protein AB7T10_05830 [bacterium]